MEIISGKNLFSIEYELYIKNKEKKELISELKDVNKEIIDLTDIKTILKVSLKEINGNNKIIIDRETLPGKTIKNCESLEIKIQKLELNRENVKLSEEIMNTIEKYNMNTKISGIHINLDKKSFFPMIIDIYEKEKNNFDFNQFREEINLKEFNYILTDETNILAKYPNNYPSIVLNKYDRIEFRAFDSNKKGINKTKNFLETLYYTKKEYDKYGIFCFEIKKNNNTLRFTTKKENLDQINETNEILNRAKSIHTILKGNNKDWISKNFVSLKKETWKKII